MRIMPKTGAFEAIVLGLSEQSHRHQAAITQFADRALTATELDPILMEACQLCADVIDVPTVRVLGFEDESGLKVRAQTRRDRPADATAPRYRFETPVSGGVPAGLCLMPGTVQSGILSSVSMPIDDTAGCFGVLELDRPYAREFNELEVGFISAIARLLGRAVARTREMEAMRLTNEALAAQLDESQTLLREIYHRVRNDLQSLEGCAYLGQRSASDPASKQAFGVLSRRLMSIAQLYDLLLVSAEPRVVAFDDYLGVLCARVRDAQDLAARGIVLDMTAGPVRLVQEQAVSFGIVANELMANAVEHAFTAQAEGTIQVRLSPCGAGSHRATLMICDDGSGMRSAPFGEGLSLAERLVAQHGGRMTHASGHGTSWTITMPCL